MCSSDLVVIPYSGLDDGTLRVLRVRAESRNYWRRGGNLKSTKTETSAKLLPMHPSLKHSLKEWRSQSIYNKPEDFVFPSERLRGIKPLDLASVLKKRIQPTFWRPVGAGRTKTFRRRSGICRTFSGRPRQRCMGSKGWSTWMMCSYSLAQAWAAARMSTATRCTRPHAAQQRFHRTQSR